MCVGADQCLASAYTPLREFPSFPLFRSFHVHSALYRGLGYVLRVTSRELGDGLETSAYIGIC